MFRLYRQKLQESQHFFAKHMTNLRAKIRTTLNTLNGRNMNELPNFSVTRKMSSTNTPLAHSVTSEDDPYIRTKVQLLFVARLLDAVLGHDSRHPRPPPRRTALVLEVPPRSVRG